MIKVVVIDDEQNAVGSLCTILNEYCKDIEICGTANSALDGVKLINQKKPDLVFLDVEMPHGTGFDLLDAVTERTFKVCFTTAYNHYAIKAIKYSAIDYLLKPLDIDEVIAVVEKNRTNYENTNTLNARYISLLENIKTTQQQKIAFPTGNGLEIINPDDIVLIEADGSYSKIILANKKVLFVSKMLKEIEDLMDGKKLFRAHNSFLINITYVARYLNKDGEYIEMSNGSIVPLSRRKKNEFLEKFKISPKE